MKEAKLTLLLGGNDVKNSGGEYQQSGRKFISKEPELQMRDTASAFIQSLQAPAHR
jgi:hypothetical protein